MKKKIQIGAFILEAMKFTGQNEDDIKKWSNGKIYSSPVLEPTEYNKSGVYLQIINFPDKLGNRHNSTMVPGDWVIKDSIGMFYPFCGIL